MADSALRIAIVGAESTGKTSLAAALAPRLADETGLRVTWVPELLREWCDRAGRTPLVHEQAAILGAHHDRIEQATVANDLVVCDTTALMTAVYSRLLFGDRSLEAHATELHRHMALTLLMALDLPWVADGHQRDGPHVREPVDTLLREALTAHSLPWAVVAGSGPARLENALDAVAPLLRNRARAGGGIFSRLASRNADRVARNWRCERCDDPACELQHVQRKG
ncbi:MAG TPA: ATP-binding protein [Rubrivivax sp.]|jgi:nicotinamide riboside kinase|nr:ATP-binding protein [Rubrivivax sp.]